MRLLFVSHSADRMGAELGLLALVRAAVREHGHDVTATVPADGPLCTELAAAGARVVVLPTRSWMGRRYNPVVGAVRLVQALASVPRYRRYLARTRPDVVVTNTAVVPAGALAARWAAVPHVWVVQESLLTNPSLRSVLPRRLIARLIARYSAGIVALSQYVADQLCGAAPAARDKVRVIPPVIERPAQPDGADPALRPDPGRPPGLARLLLLGRYTAAKGHADALAALRICRARGRELRLLLAATGDSTDREALRRLATARGVAGQLEIREWTDDPQALYGWADATLMLSRNEAYGRVTVESLLAGTPVVGYRAGGTAEILAPGGGLLVEPDPAALAEALLA
ncbi:MAG: glycosyltransferase family 4 protein, partial [Micromonosporaceae bacterium]|nr:glycosyltransferase family 4 protein [Micromonosporaceae bacterium]